MRRLAGDDVRPLELLALRRPLVDLAAGAPSKITVSAGEPDSYGSIECFPSGHQSWIRSVKVAKACSTGQSTVIDRLDRLRLCCLRAHPSLLSSSAVALKRGEGLAPEVVEVVAELAEPVRIEPVEPPRAVAPLGHEPRLLQHAQVLRDGGPADRQLVRDLADRSRAVAQLLEDRPAGRVAQRVHGSFGKPWLT